MNDSLERQSGIKFNGLRGKALTNSFPAGRMAELIRLTEGRQLPKRLRMKMNTASGERVVSVLPVASWNIRSWMGPVGHTIRYAENRTAISKRIATPFFRVMDRRVDEACSITDILTGEDLFMSSSIAQPTGWKPMTFTKAGSVSECRSSIPTTWEA